MDRKISATAPGVLPQPAKRAAERDYSLENQIPLSEEASLRRESSWPRLRAPGRLETTTVSC